MILKKIRKIIWILLGIILSLLQLSLISCAINKKMDGVYHKKKYEKTFDASVLNKYYSGQFTLSWDKKSECELTSTKDFKINPLKINDKQHQIKLFNLGNGQFRDKSDFYTIQTIGENAFKDNKNIGDTLAIPTTISKINNNAFAHTTIKNVCIKNATNFLPINENVFAGCGIKKIFTRNKSYSNDPEWNKICKNIISKPYTLNDYENFLSLRTFSIAAFRFMHNEKKISSGGCGTAWIVDKVNRNNNNDYKYWMATNLHVARAFDSTLQNVKNDTFFYTCSCQEIAGKEIDFNEPKLKQYGEIWSLKSSKWKEVGIETKNANKIYKSNYDLDFQDDLKHKHIFTDFSLIKIDFMIDKNSKLNEKDKKILQKLQRINSCLLLNNSLNTYTQNTAKDKTKFYGVGYPALINKLGIAKDKINYIFQKGEIVKSIENDGQHCDFYIVKNCPSERWLLTFGASGTMMIDENFSVIGIFWGSTGDLKIGTDDIYHDAFMFIDRFYIKENNLITKFLEI